MVKSIEVEVQGKMFRVHRCPAGVHAGLIVWREYMECNECDYNLGRDIAGSDEIDCNYEIEITQTLRGDENGSSGNNQAT